MPDHDKPTLSDFDGDILNITHNNRFMLGSKYFTFTLGGNYFDARDLFVHSKSEETIARGNINPNIIYDPLLEAFSDQDIPNVIDTIIQDTTENGNRRTFIFWDSMEAFKDRFSYEGEPRICSFAFERGFGLQNQHVSLNFDHTDIEILAKSVQGPNVKREIPDMYYTFKNNFTSSDLRTRENLVLMFEDYEAQGHIARQNAKREFKRRIGS